jgi:uncharacterized membrane protein
MSEIALPRINSFAPVAQQAEVSPEEPIFVLTRSQLQEIISRAVLPLQAELQDLKDTIVLEGEKIAALEASQDTQAENELNMLRLINDLRKDREPQPLQKDRGDILRALLAANGGKMLAKDARQKMHLSETRFSLLLSSLKDYIEVKPYNLRKNQNVLILK